METAPDVPADQFLAGAVTVPSGTGGDDSMPPSGEGRHTWHLICLDLLTAKYFEKNILRGRPPFYLPA